MKVWEEEEKKEGEEEEGRESGRGGGVKDATRGDRGLGGAIAVIIHNNKNI
jgi:hypothetical protein